MASPPSDNVPLSPISDDPFDFVTAQGGSSGGGSVLSLGSDDVVFSPDAVSASLFVASGGNSDGAAQATSDVDSEDEDLVLVGRGRAISESAPLPNPATSGSLDASSPSISDISDPLAAAPAEIPHVSDSSTIPKVIDDISGFETSSFVASPSAPALGTLQSIDEPRTGNQNSSAAVDPPVSPLIFVIPRILYTAEYSKKDEVLSNLRDCYPRLLDDLQIQIEAARSSPTLDSVAGEKETAEDLESLLIRRSELAQQILAYTKDVALELEARLPSSPPRTDSSTSRSMADKFPATSSGPHPQPAIASAARVTAVDASPTILPESGSDAVVHVEPVVQDDISVPDILRTAEYSKKTRTLSKLDRAASRKRELERLIFAHSSHPSSPSDPKSSHPAPSTLKSLRMQEKECKGHMKSIISCALLRIKKEAAPAKPKLSLVKPPTPSVTVRASASAASTVPSPSSLAKTKPSITSPKPATPSKVTPMSSPSLVIPSALRQKEYKKRKSTLQKLEALVSQLRLVLGKIVAAESARVLTSSSAHSQYTAIIGKLQKERSTIESDMKLIISAALKRANVALGLATGPKSETKTASKAPVKPTVPVVKPSSTTTGTLSKKQRKKAKKKAQKALAAASPPPSKLPTPSPPLPVSPRALDDKAKEMYTHAVEFMTSHLAAPTVKQTKDERKATCQALLAETGVALSLESLPTTLTSARKMLREQVHINVRDYTATRAQGLAALRAVMHPSHASLQRDVRKRPMSITTVKEMGLRDLLVQAFGPN